MVWRRLQTDDVSVLILNFHRGDVGREKLKNSNTDTTNELPCLPLLAGVHVPSEVYSWAAFRHVVSLPPASSAASEGQQENHRRRCRSPPRVRVGTLSEIWKYFDVVGEMSEVQVAIWLQRFEFQSAAVDVLG